MLKIKEKFKKKKCEKTNNKYKLGDKVYLLAYPYRKYGKDKIEGLGEQLKLIKMHITKIENVSDDNNTRYYTDVVTGLECEFGGYYGFNDWETIQEAFNRFVDEDYKTDLVEKTD